jgi:DNA-binding NarL/FixJ family response regulator
VVILGTVRLLQRLAEGKSMKEIGDQLNVTPNTVAFHKYRIMKTLNVKSNTEPVQIRDQKPSYCISFF